MANAVQQQKLAELIGRYVQGLPQRLHEIRQAWERLKHIEWHEKYIDIMLQEAHKLAGSGKTFQFPDISTCAATLESALLATRQPLGAGPHQQQLISAALDALEEAIRRAIATHQGKTPAAPVSAVKSQNGTSIAIIEDDPDQAALLGEWLRHGGYQTRHFSTPAAYQPHDAGEAEIILLDIHFSGYESDGLSWLEQVREKIPPHCPVIMMSTRTDLVARMRALRAGASGFISKPIALDELSGLLERAIQQATPAREKILCIDDDPDMLAFYREVLGAAGYQVETLSQPLKTLHKLEHFHPDLIILDHSMPGCSGADIAAVLRQDPQFLTLPIVFVSAHAADTLRQSPQLLVNDCLKKPVSSASLLPVVRRQLSRGAQISSHVRKVSQRPATSLLLHEGAFLAELERLISLPQVTESYQLLQISADQRDYLLAKDGRQQVARQTREIEQFLCQRPEIGGRGCVTGTLSFLILANSQDDHFAGQLHHMLSDRQWLHSGSPLTFSIGCTAFVPGAHLGDTLQRAEQACAEAIKQGGNRVNVHSATVSADTSSADNQLALALIRQKRFKMMFQPIINLESGETLFETFVRLESEDGHSFTPANFSALIASNLDGGAYSLDRWLLDQALLQLVGLGGKEAEKYSVVIRLFSSMAQIEKLIPMISNALSSSRIRGSRRVVFAIPESHLVREPERARGIFEKLAGLKCGIMLTDVGGTEFSQHVIRDAGNVDFIKLALRYGKSRQDAELITPLMEDIRQHVNANTVLVAAGVEDMSVMTAFWDKGIRYFQGYFIQRPTDVMQYNPDA